LSALLGTPLRRWAAATVAVLGLSLFITTAFGANENCPAPGPTTGYGYNGSFGYGYDFGYGYGGACPTATPTATASPTASPGAVGTITLFDSDGNPTTSFEIGEDDNTAVLDNLIAGSYQVDFAQSPGEIIGTGTTDAQGDARIAFDIPSTSHAGSATLTFLRGTTTDRTVSISILGQATATAIPAVPVATAAPTPTLPRTGADVRTFLLTAMALITLGAVLRLAARRDRVPLNAVSQSVARRTSLSDLRNGLGPSRFGRNQ
jgi:hypothetical protein